jgi:hypothetical protein
MVWPVLLLLSLVIVSSIGLVLVAFFTQVEPTSSVARMISENRGLMRLMAIVIIAPLIGVLTILDRVEGSAAVAALSAIAGYILGGTNSQ